MRPPRDAFVHAALVLAALILATPMRADAATTDKPYVAAGGIPLAGCEYGDGLGGACTTITGPAVVHVTVHDLSPLPVAVYVDLSGPSGTPTAAGRFCSSDPIDVTVPAGSYYVGVWVGGANAGLSCAPGQATIGTVTFTT